MRDKSIENQVKQLSDEWQSLNVIYEDYARTLGMPYSNLQVLSYINMIPDCTQRIICEKTFLPKQTVNSIITGFYKEGYVELKETKEDRRVKAIQLTAKGKKYSDKIMPTLFNAEYEAMAELSKTERKALLELFKKYGQLFREQIFQKDGAYTPKNKE